ncbi:HD domain-containing protein [Candidatus Methanodesulfokora washburnensis]|uniref:HD domain-containing protein n=1 Tax=Candidatus Methanodesulfokora washburnensis TaxID=2478471 RepID=A0A3R9RRN7_9CREN|nr:HD domain-containing protein [Candidatus Methanodesulfokores washburnensis]RSN76931.1 HD domain-containing protein [Candidatus Methanodesulfokores washburnensis]
MLDEIMSSANEIKSEIRRFIPETVIEEDLLDKIVEIGNEYGWGRAHMCAEKHAIKVAELTVDLWTSAENMGLVGKNLDVRRALYTAALLHDVGLWDYRNKDIHHELSAEIIRDKLQDRSLAERSSIIAYYHRKKPNPLDDERIKDDRDMLLAIAVLRIADALDYRLNRVVNHAFFSEKDEESITIEVRAKSLDIDVGRVEKKGKLLEDLLKKKMKIKMFIYRQL